MKNGFRSLKTPPNGLISQSTCKNSNSSASAWANAAAPAGLCAASMNTVGALRIRSSRPGLVTAANPARTASTSS